MLNFVTKTRMRRSERKQAESERRLGLWKQYRTLLDAGDEITNDEADQLAAIADELGFDAATLEFHAIALAQHKEWTAEEATVPKLQKEAEELEKKRKKEWQTMSEARQRFDEATEAAKRLQMKIRNKKYGNIVRWKNYLEKALPQLILGEDREPEPGWLKHLPVGEKCPLLREAAARAGLHERKTMGIHTKDYTPENQLGDDSPYETAATIAEKQHG